MALNFDDIKQVKGFQGQFVKQETEKTQVVLHHTVSGPGVKSDLNWWKQTKDRIATAVIIDRDGTIYQCFSTKYWAYHIGPVAMSFHKLGETYRKCDPNSIGVELDSWGPLVAKDGKFFPVRWNKEDKRYEPFFSAGEISPENVVEHDRPFRGFRYYEKYTDAQIKSLKDLLKYWNKYWGIPLKYDPGMWQLNRDALTGTPGVYTHASYREDKSDCHPQPELIEMLKSLKQ